MVKFQGIIGPRILDKPTFSGRAAQTEQEKYELDLNKVKHIMKTTTGRPIRDSHNVQNIGKILRNWVTKDMRWWVEFEIDNPDGDVDYVDLVRRGVLGNLSLQHMSQSLVATEVSLCKEPMRDGSSIMYEICDNPEECGSNSDFYKPSSEDILISAAKETKSNAVIIDVDMASSSKDEKDKALEMPPEFGDLLDEDGKKPRALAPGVAAPASGSGSATAADRGDDLSLGADLPPPPADQQPPRSSPSQRPPSHPNKSSSVPPTRSAPPKPQAAAAPSQPVANQFAKPLPVRTPPAQAAKPQAAAAVAATAAGMDESDEGVADPQTPAPAAVTGEPTPDELKKQQEAFDKVVWDKRVAVEDRKQISKLNLNMQLTINKLKAQVEAERKERERLEKYSKRVSSLVSNGKREIADTFAGVMAARGASKEQVDGIKQWFNDHGDPLVELGGEHLVSACRTFGDQSEHGEEYEELRNRQKMIEHARSGGTLDTFQEEPRKPRTEQRGRRALTSDSGRGAVPPVSAPAAAAPARSTPAAEPMHEVKAADDADDGASDEIPDEKISAARIGTAPAEYWTPPVSRGWRLVHETDEPAAIPKDILQLCRSQRDCGLEFKVSEAMVAMHQGTKRGHGGERMAYSGAV